MKVALSTIGTFHTFDLARELHARGSLATIFTGYPRFKLQREALPADMIKTFPWVHGPYMAVKHKERLGKKFVQAWEHVDSILFDKYVARRLPPCDVFVGLSNSALWSGQAARRAGARYVCDRGSSHIQEQDALLREEHERWGIPFAGIDPRTIEREMAEYEAADCITVPSTFNVRSFLRRGVRAGKVKRLSYGVNLTRFHPVATPQDGQFDVLFVGGLNVRKGVPYLLQAFQKLVHFRKTLTFAGSVSEELIAILRARGMWPDDVRVLGHVPQDQLKALMSRSHVMVLPSIEEGLALVQAQALACGCPVIGTDHTGAEDLFEDGQQGYIVPIRDVDALAQRMQQLADDPVLRAQMSARAVQRVQQTGGWHEYGAKASEIYQELIR